MEKFVEMQKDGKVIGVQPTSVDAYKNAGWSIIGQPKGARKVPPRSCNMEQAIGKIPFDEDRQSHSN